MPERRSYDAACWECAGGRVFLEPKKAGLLSALVRSVQGSGGSKSRFGAKGASDFDGRDGADAHHGKRDDRGQTPSPIPVRPACFRQLYSSRDGRFVVFEDAHGHLTSVDSSRFA